MIVSLRLRLLLWLLIPLTVYVGLRQTRYTYDSAMASADLVQDRALLASARMIAGQVNWQDGAPTVSIPPKRWSCLPRPAATRSTTKC